MRPKFKNPLAWEQAELLMQPAFIRVIDNIRKELEKTNWQWVYQEVQEPYPGYILCLTHLEYSVKVDIWDVCFQVCFIDYHPSEPSSDDQQQEVEIDTSLIDETKDVDWQLLETKTQQIVRNIFANLPRESK